MCDTISCDLVQAMAVLQGKSRDAVIRELQRTVSPIPILHPSIPMMPFHQNLDVNQAVNNLLSRDDDDGGEGEGSEADPLIPAAFFPSGGVAYNIIAVQSVFYCSILYLRSASLSLSFLQMNCSVCWGQWVQ